MNRLWEDTQRAMAIIEEAAREAQKINRCSSVEELAGHPDLTDLISYDSQSEILGEEMTRLAITYAYERD